VVLKLFDEVLVGCSEVLAVFVPGKVICVVGDILREDVATFVSVT